METKVSKAIGLYKQGQLKKALAIFRNFKRDFSKDEQRTIQIASDCLNGCEKFYAQLGISAVTQLTQAEMIIKNKYNIK